MGKTPRITYETVRLELTREQFFDVMMYLDSTEMETEMPELFGQLDEIWKQETFKDYE